MNMKNGGMRRSWAALIVLIFLVFYPVEIVVSQENPVLIDFNEAVKRAYTNDPGIAAREDRIRIDEYRVTESVSRFNPRLDVYSAYSRTSLESNLEFVNPLTMSPMQITLFPQDRYNIGISLSHNILNFGKRSSSRDAARAKIQISKLEKKEYERSLYDRVARVFLTALLAGDNLRIQKDNLARAKRKLEIVISRMNEGLASDYDSIRAELLLSRYENNVTSARGEFAEAKSSLKALLNLDQTQKILPVGDLDSFYVELPSGDDYDVNDDIRVLKLDRSIDVQNELIKFHKRSYLPNIGYFAKYDWQNGYQPDVDKLENFWTAGLTLNMNLFEGGGKRSRISQARYEARRAGDLKEDLISKIEADVEKARLKISIALEEISIAEKRLKLAEKGLAIADARYQQGLLSISDLLDLELEKAEAEIGLNSATYKLIMARLDLKSAEGFYPELAGS